ncbi:hypothetical protein DFH09DRAFT_1307997 [Mycena vulgaris]|nr:hypothetical protein DFH09DRAFT_1307997 [Mycena vulgaris]
MNRLRKFSKVFHKDSPAKPVETYVGKPTYRGKTPLTVSDIHGHSPVDSKGLDDPWDELEARRNRPVHRPDSKELVDLLDSFPDPPSFRAVVTNAHPGGQRFYFAEDDLLPPPPDKVLDMIKARERTWTHEARLEQQRTPPAMPRKSLVDSYNISPGRPPLYANSRLNMSTRSLGTNMSLKAGPIVQRAVVHQVDVHTSVAQIASPVTPARRSSPEAQNAMPGGARKRLRSVPTQLSPTQRLAADEELYKAYPSTLQARSKRQI